MENMVTGDARIMRYEIGMEEHRANSQKRLSRIEWADFIRHDHTVLADSK